MRKMSLVPDFWRCCGQDGCEETAGAMQREHCLQQCDSRCA